MLKVFVVLSVLYYCAMIVLFVYQMKRIRSVHMNAVLYVALNVVFAGLLPLYFAFLWLSRHGAVSVAAAILNRHSSGSSGDAQSNHASPWNPIGDAYAREAATEERYWAERKEHDRREADERKTREYYDETRRRTREWAEEQKKRNPGF